MVQRFIIIYESPISFYLGMTLPLRFSAKHARPGLVYWSIYKQSTTNVHDPATWSSIFTMKDDRASFVTGTISYRRASSSRSCLHRFPNIV